jgi:hypothetical protein
MLGEQHHAATFGATLHRRTQIFCQENWPHVVGFQRGDESFTVQIFEGNARRITRKNGDPRRRGGNFPRGGEIGLADFSRSDVARHEGKGATATRFHGVAHGFGALTIGAVADDQVGAFTREESDGGGAQTATAAGDNDSLSGEYLFGKVVPKLVVRAGLTCVPILRGHVLLECRRNLPHV